jgi:hypothetical protein
VRLHLFERLYNELTFSVDPFLFRLSTDSAPQDLWR